MGNEIHPSAVIVGEVQLGTGNYIGPMAYLHGPVSIGNGNYIGAHTVIGTPAEDAKNLGPKELQITQKYGVTLGDGNVVRELSIIHGGTKRNTSLGDRCWIHSQSHIDHDCLLSDKVVLAPCVKLGGTVEIGVEAQIGMGAAVHQNKRIGGYSMIAMNAAIVRDIPPCSLAIGVPARIRGANSKRLERLGVTADVIKQFSEYLKSGSMLPKDLPKEILDEISRFNGSNPR